MPTSAVMRYGLCARKLNDAVAAPAGASAAPLASVSPMVTVYVPGCCGTAIAMLTFCVCCGCSGGSGCGLGELARRAPEALRSSHVRPTAPEDVHARVPMLVIGTTTRVSVATSTAIAVFETW